MGKTNGKITDIEAKDIVKLEGGPDEALFFVTYIQCGLNATKAYKTLHPGVTDGSARELGSKALRKLDNRLLMRVCDLGPERYFEQLHEGLNAMKSGKRSAPWCPRRRRAAGV